MGKNLVGYKLRKEEGNKMHKAGERVGAILGTKDKVVELLGYGIYEGDFDPDNPTKDSPQAVGFVAEISRRDGRVNPRIRLDNGKIVWGCECWWGSENAVKARLSQWEAAGYSITNVDIDEVRKPYQKGEK
jgi:hypothetical protein